MDAKVSQKPFNKPDHTGPERAPISVKQFGPRGRGVVAEAHLRMGELVERSPVLVIPDGDRSLIDRTIVFTYVFVCEKGLAEEDLYRHKGRAAITLGYTGLLGHSFRPNCVFKRRIDDNFIDVIANRDSRAGEELTIDYQRTLWFDPEPI
jgi:uncharacterized protein